MFYGEVIVVQLVFCEIVTWFLLTFEFVAGLTDLKNMRVNLTLKYSVRFTSN